MIEEPLKGVRQDLIRPVADEYLVRVDIMALRDCHALRIKAKRIVQLL
jgi:hypothetical protein